MKIGIDIRTLMDARYSGVSEYTLNLIRRILKADPFTGTEQRSEYRFFYNCFGGCPNLPEFYEKNVQVMKYGYPNKIINYFLFNLFNYPQIDRDLGVDVFFMPHINFIGLSGKNFRSAGAKKKILTIHDLSFLRYPEFFSRRKNFWHKMIRVKRLAGFFDQIIAVSENTKRDIIELIGINPDKIRVIYPGVGEEYRRLSANDYRPQISDVQRKYRLPEKFILFLGTVEPRKNVDGIIRAYNQLRSINHELSDVKLIIAGEKGWKSKKIYQEWQCSEFRDDIKFLGYIEAEDKLCLYNLASVFVYPSFYEGFGLPPLEAMACGLPAVVSNSSSLPEVVGRAALAVDPYNTKEIARALGDILLNQDLKNWLVESGLKRAREFSWDKAAAGYWEVFTAGVN